MTDKTHQTDTNVYQVRVDGKPVWHPHALNQDAMSKWLELCEEYPDSYVDIVQVSTHILVSQFEYNQMKDHYSA